MISNPRNNMTVSLPKPANALSAGTSPVRIKASNTPSATTSAVAHSLRAAARPASDLRLSVTERLPAFTAAKGTLIPGRPACSV